MSDRPTLGRWMVIAANDPMVERFWDLRAPNPAFASAMKMGTAPPPGTPQLDRLCRKLGDGRLQVPRAHAERFYPLGQCIDKRVSTVETTGKLFPRSKIVLRQNTGQVEWVNSIRAELKERSGIIAQADTGFGKTVCCAEVMLQLKERTLVLVHTEFLMDQWRERLTDAGFKESHIGYVQQNRCEWGGKTLVTIAMVQTLLKRKKTLPKEFFAAFGLVVVDEVHNMGATTFRETIHMFPARYRLGVSATPHRKDGCEAVFRAHIGPIAVVGQKKKLKPIVKVVLTNLHPDENLLRKMRTPRRIPGRGLVWQENLARVESYLTTHGSRNEKLVKWILAAHKKDRNILVLTSRLAHIKLLHRLLGQRINSLKIGVLVGQMKPEDRAVSMGCPIIIATKQFVKEAFDHPRLDALFLTTPMGDIVQAVGRVLREVEGKKTPVVVDFVDNGFQLGEGLARSRWRQYRQKKWVTDDDVPGLGPRRNSRPPVETFRGMKRW